MEIAPLAYGTPHRGDPQFLNPAMLHPDGRRRENQEQNCRMTKTERPDLVTKENVDREFVLGLYDPSTHNMDGRSIRGATRRSASVRISSTITNRDNHSGGMPGSP